MLERSCSEMEIALWPPFPKEEWKVSGSISLSLSENMCCLVLYLHVVCGKLWAVPVSFRARVQLFVNGEPVLTITLIYSSYVSVLAHH